MGKINKYSNIYDKDGNLIRHVDEDGTLHNYTIDELQELVNKLTEDRDEDGNIKNPQALNNASGMLFRMYQEEPGQLHLRAMFEEFKQRAEEAKKPSTEEQVEKALNEIKEQIEPTYDVNTLEGDYVDFEEVKDESEGNTISSAA